MLGASQDDSLRECEPSRCPCGDGPCALSKYMRATSSNRHGERTALLDTEQAVAGLLPGTPPIDMESMATVQNLYRTANAVRNHLERTVLAPLDLTWSGWVVLWAMWIWGDIESRHLAAEAGISKGTLSGVVSTLETRGLVQRRSYPDDGRRLLLSLTPKGRRMMKTLFPRINQEEHHVTEVLGAAERAALAGSLRKLAMHVTE